jgi:anaerobic nitric oxide reductase transcription regulator
LLPSSPADQPRTLKEAVSDCERTHIAAAIRRHEGNFSRAARELGLERSHLYKKVKKLGLEL